MDHPKFIALNANAWRLWCQAMTYTQKHLTDGFIPDAALRQLRYYTPKCRHVLTSELIPGKGPLWHEVPGGVQVHDYLDWNDSREQVLRAREKGRQRIARLRGKDRARNGGSNAVTKNPVTAYVREMSSGGVGVSSGVPQALEEREGGAGETIADRAGAFSQWYEDAHLRYVGFGYMGTNGDWQKLLELCAKFTTRQLQDAALVWFGADDDFATSGTRSIVKFASRVSGYLATIKRKGIA